MGLLIAHRALLLSALLVGCGNPVVGPGLFDAQELGGPGPDAAGLADAATATTCAVGATSAAWALATDWSTCVALGESQFELRTYKLLRVARTRHGELWKETRQLCAVVNSPLLGQVTVFPAKLIAALPPMTVVSAVTADGSYVSGFESQLVGVQMQTPLTDAMPVEAADPRVYDVDGDGHPGGTLQVGALCSVYLASRANSMLSGKQVAPGRFAGGAVQDSSQIYFGGSTAFCTQSLPSSPNPDENRFALVRADAPGLDLDGDCDLSCDEIVKGQTLLLDWRQADNARCAQP